MGVADCPTHDWGRDCAVWSTVSCTIRFLAHYGNRGLGDENDVYLQAQGSPQ